MPKEDIPGTSTATETTSFISQGKNEGGNVDSTYSDFFQETSDGNISVGPKAQKSGLEVTTTLLGYILPVAIIGVIIGAFHVYIQGGGGSTAIKENYTFLCPYLNYGITFTSDEYKCDTMQTIENSYAKKKGELETNIITRLNEYIPIKLTKNILLTSPERKFAIQKFANKIHMDVIMEKFEEVRNSSKSLARNNIICNGISITGEGNLTTQCTIYGDSSGSDDENGKLGSARIEALRFIGELSDTGKSQFILLNPPTALSSEKLDANDPSGFLTRTTISIQATFVPFSTNEKL